MLGGSLGRVASQPNRSSEAPVSREAVRAILIDGRGRTLLFKAFNDVGMSRPFWITPGGGTATGETDSTALRRELAEECALHQFEIGPLVWMREVVFPLPGTGELIRQKERFYLVRVESHEVDISGWDEFERRFMADPRWWTVEELQESSDAFAPAALASHLVDLIQGRIPAEPFDIGG
jgi:8-oxo-dGTP pyrophosphatase MutT (NUDIX family)